MFSNDGPMARHVTATSITAEIPTKFCLTIKTGSTQCELHSWGEICYLRLLFLLMLVSVYIGHNNKELTYLFFYLLTES